MGIIDLFEDYTDRGQNLDLTQLDDGALLRLIAQARQDALGELYDRYARLVFSLAYHALGDPAGAEEVTQDVFLRVWEKAYTYKAEQAKVSTWLSSITRYRSIDMLRRQNVRPESNSIAWEDTPGDYLAASDLDPETQTEQIMEKGRVRRALTSLPEDQRTALALAYFQGLSHSEIAAVQKQPLGTVKTRIRLAMQKLRELLDEEPALQNFSPED